MMGEFTVDNQGRELRLHDGAGMISEVGYQLMLQWMAIPYLKAPEGHWAPRLSCCESGPQAIQWLAQWLVALTPDAARDIKLSRRKVGEWESLMVETECAK